MKTVNHNCLTTIAHAVGNGPIDGAHIALPRVIANPVGVIGLT